MSPWEMMLAASISAELLSCPYVHILCAPCAEYECRDCGGPLNAWQSRFCKQTVGWNVLTCGWNVLTSGYNLQVS